MKGAMDHHDRARLIQYKQRATLHEAAYLVTTSLGGTWNDAVSLLTEWVQTNRLPADVTPRIDQWTGKVTAPTDPSGTTVAVADLQALLRTLATPAGDPESNMRMSVEQGCPDRFTLYWLNKNLDEDSGFAAEALNVLRRQSMQQPAVLQETTTLASAASTLVNEWLVNRDMPCYMRGRRVDDVAALVLEQGNCDASDTVDILEGSIQLYRDDLVSLLEREGMSVPHFLRSEHPHAVQANLYVDDGQRGAVTVAPVERSAPITSALERRPERGSETDEKGTAMLANPAIQAVLMFLVGSALSLGDVHSHAWAWACWALTAALVLVSFFQWLRWPGSYGHKLESIWYLRWGGRVSLRKAAEILYSEARAQDSVWAHAAERMSLDKSPDGILCYIAEVVKQDTAIYGKRPPSTHVEKLDPLQLKYGTVKNGAREVHMRDDTKAVFTDLQVDAKEMRRALREVRESLRTTTPI